MNTSFILFVLMFGFIFNQVESKEPNKRKSVTSLNPQIEIKKWKEELLKNKLIGTPCNFISIDHESSRKWGAENPDQLDGLPSDDSKIGIGKADFDNDGKKDLLIYLSGENCTGHNGGTVEFAKIIYANGKSNSNVMQDIYSAILKQYKKNKAKDNSLEEVTDAFLDSTTTLSFNKKINGSFNLYTPIDAHCCPTYSGKYIYDPFEKKIQINVSKK